MKTACLGDIALVFNGNSISAAEKDKHYRGAQGTPYVGTAEVGFDAEINYEAGVAIPAAKLKAFKVAQAGTALVCAEGGSAGRKVGFLNREVCFGNKLFAMQPKAGWDGKFLFYFSQSEGFRDQFRALTTGLIGGVSVKKFKAIEVPDFSHGEQLRIVAVLDEAFAAIATATANAEKNLANARELFDFALDKAIMGRTGGERVARGSAQELLTSLKTLRALAVTQGRAKKFKGDVVDGNCESFGDIPKSWCWAQLEGLTTGISDGVHKTPKYVPDGIPFVTVKNLTAGSGISFDSLNYISEDDHEDYIKRTHPENGDILISKDGTIGVVRRVETDIKFSIFVSVALIKPLTNELGRYLTYALSANCVQRQIVPQGTALKHLYLNDLRRMMVPLPSPEAQEFICDRLDAISVATQELEGQYTKKLNALGDLRRALLHRAFTGELTATMPEAIAA